MKYWRNIDIEELYRIVQENRHYKNKGITGITGITGIEVMEAL